LFFKFDKSSILNVKVSGRPIADHHQVPCKLLIVNSHTKCRRVQPIDLLIDFCYTSVSKIEIVSNTYNQTVNIHNHKVSFFHLLFFACIQLSSSKLPFSYQFRVLTLIYSRLS